MNKLIRIAGPLLLVAALATACSSEPKTSSQVATPVKPPEPSMADVCFPMYDFDSMTGDVAIYYNGEPKIEAPIQTIVPGGRQSYSVYFQFPMDRPSVQLAFQRNDKSKIANFNFKWRDERTVVVIIDPTSTKVGPGNNQYVLNPDGAKTAGGRTLRKSPTLTATVATPNQLWKVSLDGKQREMMTGFDQPFFFDFLDDNSTLLVSRPMEYAQSDAPARKLYYTYDTKKKMRKSYPVDLQRSYHGEGEFIADSRGFFFTKPSFDIAYPKSDTATEIKVEGYVHGAAFTSDHSKVLMLVGDSAESNGEFELVIHDVKSGQQERVGQKVAGNAPTSQVSDARIPVVFHQEGDDMYFDMQKPEGGQVFYQFNLASKSLSTMADAKPGTPDVPKGIRIKDTQLMAVSEIDPKADAKSTSRAQLKLYDADQKTYRTIVAGLPDGTEVLGSSDDGKWIYVSTNGNLKTQ